MVARKMTEDITTYSLDETLSLGERFGRTLRGGEAIELRSDVGGGKTSFVKGIAKGMGITDVVQSPTFTISREYVAPSSLELHHYDFYRLSDPGILSAELAESVQNQKVVTVVEWADVVESVLPKNKIEIVIRATGDDEREFSFRLGEQHDYAAPKGDDT